MEIFLNGQSIISNSAGGNRDSVTNFWLGSNGGTGNFHQGQIDEFRISNIVRSNGWIETSHNNQSNVSSFLSFNAEESKPLSYINVISLPDSPGYKWQVMACDEIGDCSSWDPFDAPPNFKVDTTAPGAPA